MIWWHMMTPGPALAALDEWARTNGVDMDETGAGLCRTFGVPDPLIEDGGWAGVTGDSKPCVVVKVPHPVAVPPPLPTAAQDERQARLRNHLITMRAGLAVGRNRLWRLSGLKRHATWMAELESIDVDVRRRWLLQSRDPTIVNPHAGAHFKARTYKPLVRLAVVWLVVAYLDETSWLRPSRRVPQALRSLTEDIERFYAECELW